MIRSSFQKAELWQTKEATIPNEPNFTVISDAVYTRQELFDLVWERPVTTLAEEIAVSTTTIRQTCAKYHIPVPNRGYWSKISAGKVAVKGAFPKRLPGMAEVVQLGCRRHPSRCFGDTAPAEPTYSTTIDDLRAKVAEKLGNLGIQRCGRKMPISNQPDKRRQKILDALFTAVGMFDGQQFLANLNRNEIVIGFHQQRVRFSLAIGADSETLSLTLQSRSSSSNEYQAWHDTGERKLEEQLTVIATEIIVLAEIQQRAAAQLRFEMLSDQYREGRRRTYEDEAQRRITAHERLKRFHAAKLEILLGHSRDLSHAQTLRQLVKDVTSERNGVVDAQLAKWADYVLAEASRLDPTNNDRFLDVMMLKIEDINDVAAQVCMRHRKTCS